MFPAWKWRGKLLRNQKQDRKQQPFSMVLIHFEHTVVVYSIVAEEYVVKGKGHTVQYNNKSF